MAKPDTLVEYKSALAKLMASENISIRHRQIKTAYFDMKNRVLNCPIWTDMNGDIYDLLMGHEISHALNTPLEGWHDAQANDPKRPKIRNFLNVCEDVRIEKLIKAKYPGLRKPFANAYKTLFDRDMFKVKDREMDTLKLIDRINLHFKVGAHMTVPFNKEEQEFVDRAVDLETFDEVAQLARDIYDYQKEQQEEEKKEKEQKRDQKPQKSDPKEDKSEPQKGDESEDELDPSEGEDDSSESDSCDDGDEPEDGGLSDSDSDGDDGEDDGDEQPEDDLDEGEGGTGAEDPSDEDEDGTDASGGGAGSESEEPMSETDEAFRQEEEKLVNHFGAGQLFQTMPKANLERIIVPFDTVIDTFKAGFFHEMANPSTSGYGIKHTKINPSTLVHGINSAFNARNRGFIGMLVKEFEMRKNANQYSRQMTAKTGELDDKKLSQYKLTSDIFRKVTMISKGKSHGMVMFLDFSGSMSNTIREIIEQVLVFVSFCKKVNIPFDVYAYTDNHSYGLQSSHQFTTLNNGFNFRPSNFILIHLISSTLKGNRYREAFGMLNVAAQLGRSHDRDDKINALLPSPLYKCNMSRFGFTLGGTPLCQTIVASKEIIEQFKALHKVDIVNVVYLTDGAGDDSIRLGRDYDQMSHEERVNTTVGFEDHNTRIKVLTDDTTVVPFQTALTKLVRQVTGCTHIGYYFCDANTIEQQILNSKTLKDKQVHLDFARKYGFIAIPSIGYDNYYYVDISKMGYAENLVIRPGQNMGHVFTQHLQLRMNSKLIIRKFAIDVAE